MTRDWTGKSGYWGGATRDLLLGTPPHDLDTLTSEDIPTVDVLHEVLGDALDATKLFHGLRVAHMGTRQGYDSRDPKLSMDGMLLGFDGEHRDPVLEDPYDGYEDVLLRRARVVGLFIRPGEGSGMWSTRILFGLQDSIPTILSKISRFQLRLAPESAAMLNEFLDEAEASASGLGSAKQIVLATIARHREAIAALPPSSLTMPVPPPTTPVAAPHGLQRRVLATSE